MKLKNQSLIQITLWLYPTTPIQSQWGLIKARSWMMMLKEQIDPDGTRKAEIIPRGRDIALFALPHPECVGPFRASKKENTYIPELKKKSPIHKGRGICVVCGRKLGQWNQSDRHSSHTVESDVRSQSLPRTSKNSEASE